MGVFFTFFELRKWQQIAQSITSILRGAAGGGGGIHTQNVTLNINMTLGGGSLLS